MDKREGGSLLKIKKQRFRFSDAPRPGKDIEKPAATTKSSLCDQLGEPKEQDDKSVSGKENCIGTTLLKGRAVAAAKCAFGGREEVGEL